MKLWPVLTGIALSFTLIACKAPTPPKGVQPITNFDANRYLGKWYEIARLENRFERGLEQVSATYGKRNDGGIRVLNRGYDPTKNKWSESEGKAYFTGDTKTGFAPIFPDTCYHLTHYWLAAVDIPVASDNPVHYADAIRYNARTPLQGSLLPLTRLVWA